MSVQSLNVIYRAIRAGCQCEEVSTGLTIASAVDFAVPENNECLRVGNNWLVLRDVNLDGSSRIRIDIFETDCDDVISDIGVNDVIFQYASGPCDIVVPEIFEEDPPENGRAFLVGNPGDYYDQCDEVPSPEERMADVYFNIVNDRLLRTPVRIVVSFIPES